METVMWCLGIKWVHSSDKNYYLIGFITEKKKKQYSTKLNLYYDNNITNETKICN